MQECYRCKGYFDPDDITGHHDGNDYCTECLTKVKMKEALLAHHKPIDEGVGRDLAFHMPVEADEGLGIFVDSMLMGDML